MKEIPHKVIEVGFDFEWDPSKVWVLDEPVVSMDISELLWHFSVPFLWEGEKPVTPQEILDQPLAHPLEYARMLLADTSYPIDIMQNKGRWLILDGLHRLMKLYNQGQQDVLVRIIPREKIPEIAK